MAGDVETAASDVILPAQESATSMAVKHGGKYCKCTCDYEYVRTGLKKKKNHHPCKYFFEQPRSYLV